MANYDFFQHKQCEYFPCHPGADPERFSCLFCYCPLYSLGDRCGGDFTYTENGIKDCSNCLRPHCRENYAFIQKQLDQVIEMTMRKEKENAAGGPESP